MTLNVKIIVIGTCVLGLAIATLLTENFKNIFVLEKQRTLYTTKKQMS